MQTTKEHKLIDNYVMFTGIITAVGEITRFEDRGDDRRLAVEVGELGLDDISAGDSISVNGVCLTATSLSGNVFYADVSGETLACTTFADLAEGDRVNLEKAMRLSDRLGGHLVSGHVDGVGTILAMHEDARSMRYVVQVPPGLNQYICKKGSICVNGVSLTVNDTGQSTFDINIIPHTMEETIFPDYREGTRVNLEVDIIARYLERLSSAVS